MVITLFPWCLTGCDDGFFPSDKTKETSYRVCLLCTGVECLCLQENYTSQLRET